MRREEERMRREEDRARREEEIHEMRKKDSKHQEQMSMAFQAAMAGLTAYFASKSSSSS